MPGSKSSRSKSSRSKSPGSKSPRSKSPRSKSNEKQLMEFMQTNELAIIFVIFSMFYGIDIRKLNKMKISENDFNEICDYLKENQLSDLIPQLHFILPMVEVLILHSKSHDTMVIKRLFRLFGLEDDIDTFMKLFKSKSSKSSTSTDIREVDEFSPEMEILRQKGGSGVLTLFKKMKITKDFYTFLSFISLLLSMYCIWIQSRHLLRDMEKNENIQIGLRLVQSAHTCKKVELTSNQKLIAKFTGTVSGLFGANAQDHVEGIMYLSECLLKYPEKIKLDITEVDVIYNEKPNEKGTTNELGLYNEVNVDDFVMSSGVVPLGFDFDKKNFHVEMNLIKRAVIKPEISDSELNEVSRKIANKILKKQPLIADSMKEQNIQPEKNIQPVIPREPSYLELVYAVVKEGVENIDFPRIAAGFMTGEDLKAMLEAQIRRYILEKRFELKNTQTKTEYFIDSLLIDVPLYIGTVYALVKYIQWFCGNLITFSYLVSTYFKKPQLAITNGDGNNRQLIRTRTRRGGKLFNKNHTKKSHKK